MPVKLIWASPTPMMDFICPRPGIEAEAGGAFAQLAEVVNIYDQERRV